MLDFSQIRYKLDRFGSTYLYFFFLNTLSLKYTKSILKSLHSTYVEVFFGLWEMIHPTSRYASLVLWVGYQIGLKRQQITFFVFKINSKYYFFILDRGLHNISTFFMIFCLRKQDPFTILVYLFVPSSLLYEKDITRFSTRDIRC